MNTYYRGGQNKNRVATRPDDRQAPSRGTECKRREHVAPFPSATIGQGLKRLPRVVVHWWLKGWKWACVDEAERQLKDGRSDWHWIW